MRSASFFDQPTVRWSWSSCSAEYGLPPESKSFAAAQYSMKSLIICLDSSAEEDRARMQACTRRLDFLGQVEQLTGMSLARKKGDGRKVRKKMKLAVPGNPLDPIDTSYKI
jgi:hypothetical protein